MTLSPDKLREIVRTANLAPSVHNTQPTRWGLETDGSIVLSIDGSRRLRIGDPEGRDARLSCGTALEGTRLALSELGLGIRSVETVAPRLDATVSVAVRMNIGETNEPEPLAGAVRRRFTWRGGFAPTSIEKQRALAETVSARDDVTLVAEPANLAALAKINDETSLMFFRDRAFRSELLHWMRFSVSDPRWDRDGMNAPALGMGGFEAKAAAVALRSPAFDILDAVGVSRSIVSESAKTKSATAILLFHRPGGEDPIHSGVAFYRLWLALTAIGLAAWPMAAVADRTESRAEVSTRFGVASGRRLLNLLRVGTMPADARPGRARLPPDSLIH